MVSYGENCLSLEAQNGYHWQLVHISLATIKFLIISNMWLHRQNSSDDNLFQWVWYCTCFYTTVCLEAPVESAYADLQLLSCISNTKEYVEYCHTLFAMPILALVGFYKLPVLHFQFFVKHACSLGSLLCHKCCTWCNEPIAIRHNWSTQHILELWGPLELTMKLYI